MVKIRSSGFSFVLGALLACFILLSASVITSCSSRLVLATSGDGRIVVDPRSGHREVIISMRLRLVSTPDSVESLYFMPDTLVTPFKVSSDVVY